MATNSKVRIIAFVGLAGSGKSSAADYLAANGMPKITFETILETIKEIRNLIDAGQSRIVISSIPDMQAYLQLKHAFPGQLTVIALTPAKTTRYKRLKRAFGNLHHFKEKEIFSAGEIVAHADYTIDTSGTTDDLQQKIDEILKQIGISL
jgi:dephospho-CoA kinase